MDIKRVNDYENAKKQELKEFKNSLIDFDKKLEIYYKLINSLKKVCHLSNLYIFLILFTSNTYIPFILILINFCIIKYGNKMIYKLDQIKISAKNSFKEELKILSEIIDSCELLKSFLRGKTLMSEDLSKIVSYLYLEFGNNLNDVIDQISKQNDCNIELLNETSVILSSSMDIDNLNYDNSDKNEMKRILKR